MANDILPSEIPFFSGNSIVATDYTFDASAKTVTIASTRYKRMLYIVNTTHGEVIYNPYSENLSGTLSPTGVTLDFPTNTYMSNSDNLLVMYEGDSTSGESPLTPFDEVLTSQRQNLIELKSNNNIVSALRDVTTIAGSATVTAANSEYVLATTALANDSATLDSAEKGRYQAGYSAEAGLGIRYAGTPTGAMQVKWGYFDTNNGFYFGRDATGIFIATLTGGSETKVYQTSWNADKLNGTGASGLTLSLSKGNIFQIRYSWYGYGAVYFTVVINDANNVQRNIVVHRFSATATTNIIDPNQPIRAKIENGATATAHTLYVAGRQYSILGKYNPNVRNTGQYRLLQGSITSAAFVPLITFRRKSAFESTSVKIRHYTLISDQALIVQVRLNGSLTGASYITPSDYTAQEAAVEADISATAITGGNVIDDDIMGGGALANRSSDAKTFGTVSFDFIGVQPVTLCARAVSTTATVTSHVAVIEEW